MTHAIIIGGGIAGPVTGVALRRAGLTATVYEAHAERGGLELGGWLTVAVNGIDALRTLGLSAAVLARGFPSERIQFFSGSGKRLGELPIGGKLADGTVTHTLRRADLVGVLQAEALARGVGFEHGKRLVSAETTADGAVIARFSDGSEARGDVLIGADGVRSRVRHLLDPGAPGPNYTGLGNMGGFTPAGVVDLPPCSCMMVFGKRAFFGLVVHPSGELWWFVNPPRRTEIERRELAETGDEAWKQRLAALFDDDRSPAAQIVRAATGPIVAANQYDLPRVPTWRRGAMVIVGDAAHAASPSSGQGASMAIEDAVALARCLRDAPGVPAALAAFEQLRRARVERVVAHGARMGGYKTVGPLGRMLRDLVLPTILRRLGGADSSHWLFDHHVEWGPESATIHNDGTWAHERM